jgi:hypothetical protein
MELQSLLILLLALILTVVASWSLSTFLRLHIAASKINSDRELKDSCNVTMSYVNIGKTMAIVLVVISVLVLLASSFWFIRSLQKH